MFKNGWYTGYMRSIDGRGLIPIRKFSTILWIIGKGDSHKRGFDAAADKVADMFKW